MPSQLARPAADVLVVSHYQAECQETGCTWIGVIRSDFGDAEQDKASHEAVHAIRAGVVPRAI